MSQSPRDVHLQFISLERILIPFVDGIIEYFFSIFFSSLMKSSLLNLPNLCSRSQQGTECRKIKVLKTLSVYWLKKWHTAAVALILRTNGALVTHRFKREEKLEPNINSNFNFFLLLLHASATKFFKTPFFLTPLFCFFSSLHLFVFIFNIFNLCCCYSEFILGLVEKKLGVGWEGS